MKKLKNWCKRHTFLSVFLLLFIPFETLNFTGFCYWELSYLSDEQLINRSILGKDWWKNDKYDSEEAIANDPKVIKFKQDNPYCCEITRYGLMKETSVESPEHIILNRLFGWYRAVIRKHSKQKYLWNPKEPYIETIYLINACGRRQYHWGSMPLTENEYLRKINFKKQLERNYDSRTN